MSGSNDALAVAALRDEVAGLTKRVIRGERQRRLFFWSQMIQWVVDGVLLVLFITFLAQRGDSRDYYNTQLRNLACLALHYLPSSSPFAQDLRAQYPNCPQYMRPGGVRTLPSHSPSHIPRALPGRSTSTPHTSSAAASRPSAGARRPGPIVRPSATPRSSRSAPTPTVTRTARPSPTATATPGVLNQALCPVVTLSVLC